MKEPVLGNTPPAPKGKEWSASYKKFIICSTIGVLIFLCPFNIDGKTTILLGVITDMLQNFVGDTSKIIALAIVSLSFIGALIVKLFKLNLNNKPALKRLFQVTWFWFFIRLVGAVFIWMIYLQKGPNFIIHKYTGGVIFNDLIPILLPLFFVAVLTLPLLTDYGLMEFMGTLVQKIFKKLFRLPGRSSVDALSSWFGSPSIGVLVTMKQYDQSFYSLREASIIATTFSVASTAFTYAVAKTIGISEQFVPYYLTIVLAGFVCALIIPRIPPLSRKPDTYFSGKSALTEAIPKDYTMYKWAINRAVTRAYEVPKPIQVLKDSMVNLFDIYLGLIPVVFTIGTIGLGLSENTSIFQWLGTPLEPYLKLLDIPDAAKAAPTMVMGFADMYLPALVGKGIDNEMTRFIIGAASITQVIYMSEVGALLLKSNINISIIEMFIIFIIRTIISLPIISLMAHLVY